MDNLERSLCRINNNNAFKFYFDKKDTISGTAFNTLGRIDEMCEKPYRLDFHLDIPINWTTNEGCSFVELRNYLFISMMKKIEEHPQFYKNVDGNLESLLMDVKNPKDQTFTGCFTFRRPNDNFFLDVSLQYAPRIVKNVKIKIYSPD